MKNNAMLKAGKTKPTIGTKIEGKNAAAIFFSENIFLIINIINKLILLIIYQKKSEYNINIVRF